MGKSRTSTRMAAAALVVVSAGLLVVVLGAIPSVAGPQEPPPTEPPTTPPPTTAPPTTEPPTTPPPPTAPPPTSAAPPPTAARPPTTTTTTAPPPTTAVEEAPATTPEPTTTTTGAPVSLVPPVGDTVPTRTSDGQGAGLSSGAKLALVVASLIAVAVALGVLTFLYWRHTRPRRRESFGAVDVVTEPESSAVPVAETTAASPDHAPIGTPLAGAGVIFGREQAVEPPPIVTADELFGPRNDEPAPEVEPPTVRAELWGDHDSEPVSPAPEQRR